MSKKLFTFLVALVAGIGLCWADESGLCGENLTYEFNSSTGELTISGTGTKMDRIEWEWMEWKKQVTSVSLPENLTIIDGSQAFADFKISSITLPEGLTSLGESLVFHRCTSLTSIVLPAGISTIPQSTFLKCTSLATVTLPAALTSIGYGAFMSCYALNTIYCYAENPPTLGNDVFLDDNTWQPMDLSNVTLYVPYNSIADYQAANGWKDFGTIAAIPGTEPTYTVALRDGTVNADKVTLSATSAVEGATVTVTPNEEYEITEFWANYSVVVGQLGTIYTIDATLDPGTGAYSFTMPAANVTIEATIAVKPASSDEHITANEDPQHTGVYYSTFYDSANKYELPAGVEAYIVTTVSGDAMQLQKVAEEGQIIPADAGVILKASDTPFILTQSDADAVSVEGNILQGADDDITTPSNCYVLSCENNLVGFYHYTASNLNPHKAYITLGGASGAPKRLRFVFNQEEVATGVENVQGAEVQSTKVIENGVLYIIQNGAKYNAQGQMVK